MEEEGWMPARGNGVLRGTGVVWCGKIQHEDCGRAAWGLDRARGRRGRACSGAVDFFILWGGAGTWMTGDWSKTFGGFAGGSWANQYSSCRDSPAGCIGIDRGIEIFVPVILFLAVGAGEGKKLCRVMPPFHECYISRLHSHSHSHFHHAFPPV